MPWIVYAERPKTLTHRWEYRHGHFPKTVPDKKLALQLADEARSKGGNKVRIEKVK